MQILILKTEFWRGQRLLLLAFLLLHTVASYYYIAHQDITHDEPQYIEYAKRWLHGKPEREKFSDDSKSPVIAICWIPRIVTQVVRPGYHLNDFGRKDQEAGRHMMIIFSFITALYVYWWCKELYGDKGWRLPLLLLLFDPLYLSFSTIITTDLACGAFLVALLYHYRKFIITRHKKQFYLTAAYTGVAIVTKQDMLFVIILLPIVSLMRYGIKKEHSRLITRHTFFDIIVFASIVIAVINFSYYFYQSFIPFGQYSFQSQGFKQLQQQMSFLHWLPVPFPKPYIQSLDLIKANAEFGAGKPRSTYNGVYLFGQLKQTGGFWYYYFVLLFYKMPIGIMVLIFASIVLFIKNFRKKVFIQQYIFLIIPILFYLLVLSFFNTFQIGIRHLLLVFPLLYIGFGKLFDYAKKANVWLKVLVVGAVVYSFISVAAYYPDIIPYTNEFITNKKQVYEKIFDSSIDYGQADASLLTFLSMHPEYKRPTAVPDTGKYAIPMDYLFNSENKFKTSYNWYRKLQPADVYRYLVLLYTIKKEDLVKAGLR